MAKLKPDPSKLLIRAQSRVYADDYNYVVHVLGGSVSGLQNEITRELFHRFARYLRTLNLEPYDTDRNTLSQLRRVLRDAVVTQLAPGAYTDGHG